VWSAWSPQEITARKSAVGFFFAFCAFFVPFAAIPALP
jgi:hypothetical protein